MKNERPHRVIFFLKKKKELEIHSSRYKMKVLKEEKEQKKRRWQRQEKEETQEEEVEGGAL